LYFLLRLDHRQETVRIEDTGLLRWR